MDKSLSLLFSILIVALVEGESLENFSENQVQDIEIEGIFDKSVTYPGIGTFNQDDFFDLIHRPLLLLPQSPEKINPKFIFYTRKNPKEPQYLSWSSPEKNNQTNFDSKNPTKFIIHGFLDNQWLGPWMRTVKDEFLIHGDMNVVIVDWSGGNSLPYGQATVNTRIVGAVIANLIKNLQKTNGLSLKDVHLIGHSLGAQICGYAGERLDKVGRITGLDPAGPYFEWLPSRVRLDKTDAEFVDVIHSNALSLIPYLGLGVEQPAGHIDFYPNGGKKQPKCDQQKFTSIIIDGFPEGLRRFVECDHQRSADFFTASINHYKNIPVGYKCTDFQLFSKGLCSDCGSNGNECAIMGYRADEWRKFINTQKEDIKFYLKTTGDYPYFVTNYQIKVKLGVTGDRDPLGSIIVTIKGEKATEKVVVLDKEKIVQGNTYNYLLNVDGELGNMTKVSIMWKTAGLPFLSHNVVNFEKITIDPMFIVYKQQRQSHSFCNKQGNVKTNKEIDLIDC